MRYAIVFMAMVVFNCLMVFSASSSKPLIVCSSVLTQTPSMGNELILATRIFNRNNNTIYNIEVDEGSYDESQLTLLYGNLRVKIEMLEPGANVSHIVVFVPKKTGLLKLNEPVIKYVDGWFGKTMYMVSSIPNGGVLNVHSPSQSYVSNIPKYYEWGVFCGIALSAISIPVLYYVVSINHS